MKFPVNVHCQPRFNIIRTTKRVSNPVQFGNQNSTINQADYRKYLDMAIAFSKQSPDPSKKIGSVIVTPSGQIIKGRNAFPRGFTPDAIYYNLSDRAINGAYRYPRTVHAERDAIDQAASQGIGIQGSSMFITAPPCATCAASIVNSGIRKIVYPKDALEDKGFASRWEKELAIGRDLLTNSSPSIEIVAI